jgi:replicative DNA helicase
MEKTEIKKNWKDSLISAGSERQLITICLNNNDNIVECEEKGVTPEMFIIDGHRYIYMAMKYLYETNQTPEPLAILEVIADNKAKDSIKELGGLEYITALMNAPAIDRNIEIYVKKLKQTLTRRQIASLSEATLNRVLDESSKVLNPSELVGEVQKDLDELSMSANQVEEVYKMGTDLAERIKEFGACPQVIPGLETGFYQFDRYTGGAEPSDLIFVCARSKTGKSVLLTNWAEKIAIQDGLPVLYIDTEMPTPQVETRLLSMNSGIPEKEQIKSGMFTIDDEYGLADDKLERLKRANEKINNGLLYHVYMPGFNIDKVVALARKYKMKYGIVAVFFDYLKMPQANKGALKYAQEYQELGFMASALKDMAGTLEIPVFSAVQANRSEKGATAEDMDEGNVGGSDRILQLASKLCFLANKPEEEYALNPHLGNQHLRIKFQRNGACDCPPINIQFDHKIIRMREVN